MAIDESGFVSPQAMAFIRAFVEDSVLKDFKGLPQRLETLQSSMADLKKDVANLQHAVYMGNGSSIKTQLALLADRQSRLERTLLFVGIPVVMAIIVIAVKMV